MHPELKVRVRFYRCQNPERYNRRLWQRCRQFFVFYRFELVCFGQLQFRGLFPDPTLSKLAEPRQPLKGYLYISYVLFLSASSIISFSNFLISSNFLRLTITSCSVGFTCS